MKSLTQVKNDENKINEMNQEENNLLSEEIAKKLKTQKKEFEEKIKNLHFTIEELKMNLTVCEMQLDMERGNFDVLMTEKKNEIQNIQKQYKNICTKNSLLKEKLKESSDNIEEIQKELDDYKRNHGKVHSTSDSSNLETDEIFKKNSISSINKNSKEELDSSRFYQIKPDSNFEKDDSINILEDINGYSINQDKDLFIPQIGERT